VACAYVNLLHKKVNAALKNTKALVATSQEFCLEVSTEKTK
jgi:hypothetical protein